ncbi:MAG TPA: hypothetical protein DF984_00010 [Anaerolineaceae bacterium]|nr:hypothetical protein [Anaerolineaceae bacterium]
MRNRLIPRQFQADQDGESNPRNRQDTASAWDVVVLSFKLLFQRIQFWIRPNILSALLSLPVLTGPGAKAALFHTVAAGLQDPAGSEVKVRQEMKQGFHAYFWKALLLSILRLVSFAIILASIYFWVTRPEIGVRFISILAFYGLVLWLFTSLYLYPILVSQPEAAVVDVVRKAIELAFRKPFESLLFAIVDSLLMIFGLALLGPMMLIVPALRSILSLQGYWFLIGEEIPGFLSIEAYAKRKYRENVRGTEK